MATKIRRSLYIGLGGTGMKALLHTKKMFIDTYGEVPPMIGFLGIDTDGGEFTKSVTSNRGEVVALNANEQVNLFTGGADMYYQSNRADFTWVPQCNVGKISMLNGVGAGGVRTNGRVALTINHNSLLSLVQSKMNSITNAAIIQNERYALLSNDPPEIHMVFSICGGTGCGTFLNMAYILKQVNPHLKVTGYAVMPGAFAGLAANAHVFPNTYGALYDLDYMMHHGMGKNPITIKYINQIYNATERPFSNVMLIDNTNVYGDNYGEVDNLAKMISLALVSAAGELSVAGASVGDNFNVIISQGNLDVKNKKAWAGGMGASEIVYRGEVLADIYRMKAAQNLIDRLQMSGEDVNSIANAWIDSAEVKIRENNGRDDVTDYIADKSPKFELSISDNSNPRPDVDQNIESNRIKTEDVDKKVDALLTRVRGELRNLIVKNINGEGGVALAKKILAELKAQMEICLGEMKVEKDGLNGKLPTFSSKIDVLINDIKEAAKSIFTRGRVRGFVDDLQQVVKNYNTVLRDIQRHDAAITIYNSILVLIKESAEKVECIKKLLDGVNANLTRKIGTLQNGVADENSVFQLNLAEDDATRIVVDTTEIVVSDFVNTLGGEFKIYGLGEYSVIEVENFFMEYTKGLEGASVYANKSVEMALEELYKSDPDALRNKIALAARKAMPLISYSDKGLPPQQPMIDMIYVGVEDKDKSFLNEGGLFEQILPTAVGQVTRNVAFASTGMKDKVIIYNQLGVIPIFKLTNIDNYYERYRDSYATPAAHHVDDDLFQRSVHEQFQIKPDTGLSQTIDYWVKGFIYGLIKNENRCYYIKCRQLGDPLRQHWVRLAEWRNEAYERFKAQEQIFVSEIRSHIEAENESKGAQAINELVDDVKVNYFENYSQIRISMETLMGHGYERVADLMREELDFVERM